MPTMHRLAALMGALVVVGGCAAPDSDSALLPDLPASATSTTSTTSTTGATSSAVPQQSPSQPAPPPDAAPAAVAAWIAAGRPADPAGYQTVERDDTTTQLEGDEVAFRLPGPLEPNHLAGCIRRWAPNLSCLPGLRDTPDRPDGLVGQWIPGWVDFDGSMISIGSVHGDPGVFNDGAGKVLPYGDSLKFGDYQCRSDPSGLYCVSLSRQTGMRLSDTVTAFGCVRQATPPYGIGQQFFCD
ncbi:hypothetical protein KIH27_16700 [Mycobacterium sp. M1]|uniref:Lipoprotein LppI n=1 Tax=Mycolicibacter acidiphilus TaxID=2835306 RepID=A0ABS5RM14_9MYCO|nr:hypothetical protein [Mycolicibacter acidiphilus]MBS9535229.1 hypothetical protein [Mycolicibacter acidiphilus]